MKKHLETLLLKRDQLLEVLRGLGRVAVAFSGGIDSTVVAKAAHLALGDAPSPSRPTARACPRARSTTPAGWPSCIGIRHEVVRTEEFADPDYLKNDGARCYHCKSELYSPHRDAAAASWAPTSICSGANLDDLGDYRPGLKAAAEHGVRHPLQEAGFTKADVRAWPGTGACRPGTSRRRRACRAGWRRACRSRRSAPARVEAGRGVPAALGCASAACGCTRATWPASRCRPARLAAAGRADGARGAGAAAEGAGLQVRDARPGRLPLRQPERAGPLELKRLFARPEPTP